MKTIFVALLIAYIVSGCAGQTIGGQGVVSVGDPTTRTHIKTELTAVDYLAMAENVTNKMLSSPFAQSWPEDIPRFVVGDLLNNTDNEEIRTSDIQARITETLVNSGLVRVLDVSATSFDYIISSELNSTRQVEGSKELVYFTLIVKINTVEGEYKGQWSDDIQLNKL